jgi:hypothetical protein
LVSGKCFTKSQGTHFKILGTPRKFVLLHATSGDQGRKEMPGGDITQFTTRDRWW